jgi:TatD DNase family protein
MEKSEKKSKPTRTRPGKEERKASKARVPNESMDMGVHLSHPKFRTDAPQVLDFAAQKHGVTRFLSLTSNLTMLPKSLNLCRSYPSVRCTIGVSPRFAQEWEGKTTLTSMKQWVQKHPQVIRAVGEIGLDYTILSHVSLEEQMACFESQIKFAIDNKLPLVIHERDAHHDMLDILDQYTEKSPRVLIRGFCGTKMELEAYTSRGFYISVNGMITHTDSRGDTRGETLRSIIHLVPLRHLMVESNSPFAIPYVSSDLLTNPSRNEPCTLPLIMETTWKAYNAGGKEANPDTFTPLEYSAFTANLNANSRAFLSIV